MCTNPITLDANTQVACRRCNACIGAKINDWVARGMAEKATAGHTLIIRLSYRDLPDGNQPLGARVFAYADLQRFYKLLRKRYKEFYGNTGEIRYINCGERGSRNDRVHWHCVIYSDLPLDALGHVTDFATKEPRWRLPYERNAEWSVWPHGHVYVSEATQEGMSYTLKYTVKDAFNTIRSEGTAREHKSERHTASMFRMSKKPPIGRRWLRRYLDQMEALRAVPPKLELKIPDYNGYWWPKGDDREYLIAGLHRVNQKIREETGHDSPQWNALVRHVERTKQEKDEDQLLNGEIEKAQGAQATNSENEFKQFEQELRRKQDKQAQYKADSRCVRACGHVLPCSDCSLWYKEESLQVARAYEQKAREDFERENEESNPTNREGRHEREKRFRRWQRRKNTPSYWCLAKDTKYVKEAFERHKKRTDAEEAITRANRKTPRERGS